LSMLLDKINEHAGGSTTDSALLGPFYVEGRPTAANGGDISNGVAGTPMFVTGRVVDDHGKPIAGAHVDTWHSDGAGFYDVQQTEKLHDEFAMRALLTTDAEGYQSLITQLFLRDDPYIGRDAVFADQTSLQADFVRHEPGIAPDGTTIEEPFVTLDWTFTLATK
jgi:hydroxyquinol 1,2-dioxygenase